MGVEEILVHLSGPSSKKDDKRFQAMALAYDNFQYVIRFRGNERDTLTNAVQESLDTSKDLAPMPTTSSTLSEVGSTQVPRTGLKKTAILQSIDRLTSDQQAQCTYIEDSPLAAAAIESQLWSSPVQPTSANTSSPLGYGAAKRRRLSCHDELSSDLYHSAPSAPSNLEVDSTIVHKDVMQDGQHIESGISSSPIHYVSSRKFLEVGPATAPARVYAQPTVTPGTQTRVPDPTMNPSSPTLIPSAPAEPSSSAETYKTAPPAAESLTASPAKPLPEAGPPPSASKNIPPPSSTPLPTAPAALSLPAVPAPPTTSAVPSLTNHNSKPLQPRTTITITPPPPPTGFLLSPQPNTTIPITASLARIMATLELSTRYKPTQQNRALEPLERGHWRVDTRTWTGPGANVAQADFWTSLCAFVESGKAGWDVLVMREGEINAVSVDVAMGTSARSNVNGRPQDGAVRDQAETEDGSLGTIRFSHFGGVAEHIYLLLFITSKSRIRKCVVEWIDAGGEVVVRI